MKDDNMNRKLQVYLWSKNPNSLHNDLFIAMNYHLDGTG